jgi:hypothetical protein
VPYTIYPARPAAGPATPRQVWDALRQSPQVLFLAVFGLALLVAAASWTNAQDTTTATASSPEHRAPGSMPASWLQQASLLTVYGRGFHTAPVLGRLGLAGSFDQLQQQTAGARAAIGRLNGHQPVHMALHLIYGMAAPCTGTTDTCLVYLDDEPGVDLVRDYIRPAAARGWLVILDDQLGRSTPAEEIARLQAKGYLSYDNVEVAFDPEFRTVPGQMTPGSPTGQVTAAEINAAEGAIERAVSGESLAHRKLLLVHQWTPDMIVDRDHLVTNLTDVQPAVIMDGIGPADEKAAAYNALMAGSLPAGVTPGIKLFLPNPYGVPGGEDMPGLTWPQVLGRAPVLSATGIRTTIGPVPRIIVLS